MRQVSQNYRSGRIRIQQVCTPGLRKTGVLVRTRYSVVSIGTEAMKVKESQLGYVGKARARPDQVKKVLETIQQQGIVATYQKVLNKLDTLTPLGYSCAGVIEAVGSEVSGLSVGQRVACAGAGYANHAEVNFVPKHLVVPIPDSVPSIQAAFATIGSIALHGVRQGGMQLGEKACVIGLGLLGQLVVQILRASAVGVIGVDIREDRCQLAESLGAYRAVQSSDPALPTIVKRFTQGRGADCVFLTAGGASNAVTELAVELSRDRARIVDIGKTKIDLPWNECYMKELEVRFSRSYGPGRYDTQYEEQGIDYPIGYVRWTEQRNMSAFLELLAEGRIKLDELLSSVRKFHEAETVYEELSKGKELGLGIVFDYGEDTIRQPAPPPLKTVKTTAVTSAEKLRIGVVGAGNYASSMLLPWLVKDPNVRLVVVATATSLSSQNAREKFGFERATTSYPDILAADDIDIVIVATRHSTHAAIVAEALMAGKAVFVEKPLALDINEVEQIRQAVTHSGNPRLMVGFNRRFAPLVKRAKETFAAVRGPVVAQYRIHAGQLPEQSWYSSASEGSRFIGEGGHFLDTLAFITDSRPVSIFAQNLNGTPSLEDDNENVVAIVKFEDGSVGAVSYLTQGAIKVPKEHLEVFGGGTTAILDNFRTLQTFTGAKVTKSRAGSGDKGQQEELRAFVEAVRSGAEMPIAIDCLLDTTLATIAVRDSATNKSIVQLADYWE